MKHKTWLRLVLKCIGILLIGMGLPEAIRQSGVLVQLYRMHVSARSQGSMPAFFGPNGPGLGYTVNVLAGFLQVAMGTYLLLGGKWVVNGLVPSNRPYCPDCGYPLGGVQGGACPECGAAAPRQPEQGGARTPPNA